MKIKKVEITGFKSFMEKISLTFPEKITAIVGPNGCGKSNIVDSIRWVIGEQSSKHLRGRGMEDMIFNGSEKHSPLGMAEVKITFTNDSVNVPVNYSEYSEITVARRLYKSGESEYSINNTPCRLMDIRELFMDTGISAKAYAIVEQGKVDAIVNSKPDDRRIIIEEAAGITKYKSRKDSALKKIESTKLNLNRTTDILSEIKKQLGSVERQAKKAEEFKNLRKDFKEIEIALMRVESESVRDELDHIENDLKNTEESLIESSKNLKVKENELELMKIESLDVEKRLSKMQEEYLNKLDDIRKKENEIEFKERQKEELFKHKSNNQFEIEELKTRIKELKKESEDSGRRIKKVEDRFYDEEKKILDLQKEYEALGSGYKEKEGLIDREKGKLVDILTGIARTKNDISNSEQHISSFGRSFEKLKKEEGFIKEHMLKTAKHIKDLEISCSRIESEREELKRKSIQNQCRLDELQESHDLKEDEMTAAGDDLKDTSAHLKSLSELKSGYEGFNTGVRAVMEAKDEIGAGKDILGVVTDFIDVDPAYETAVSSLLGEKLEYIIVRNNSAITKSVEYLKQSGKGKAGFVTVDNSGAKKGVAPGPSHIAKTVRIDSEVKDTILGLFGEAHYVREFEGALAGRGKNSGRTYVTDDGDIVGDYIYAGSRNVKGEAILRREREIRELELKKNELGSRYDEEAKLLEDIKKEIEKTMLEQEGIKDSLHEVKIKSIEIQNRINSSKEEEGRLKERDSVIKYELDDLKSQTDDLHNRLLISKVKLEENLADKDKIEELIAKLSGECKDLRSALESGNEELTKTRVNSARLKAEKENLVKTLEHLQQTLDASSKRMTKLKNDIEIIEKEETGIKSKIKEIEKELKTSISMSEKSKAAVENLKGEFEKNMARLRGDEVELSKMRNNFNDITGRKNEALLKKEEALLNLRHIAERLGEKHQITLAELDSIEMPADFDRESALKRLDILKNKIHEMGEVNLLAIEEYEELNKRYSFLVEQREDLLKSINTLNKAIKRINRTSIRRFKDTFELVNEKFKILFPKLFSGGHAELRLNDEENLLETGVEIVAQPPGKKLQNISLLSGGEKALTAVSLIFAIFMIKPSPFCLLDEVDAPLDDANIGRFNELVKEMSGNSQFIIITHNKNTMETADTLYGVTMESPGISKIVSVQMN